MFIPFVVVGNSAFAKFFNSGDGSSGQQKTTSKTRSEGLAIGTLNIFYSA